MTFRNIWALAIPVLFVACGKAEVDPEVPDNKADNKADNEALAACGTEACSSFAQRIEDGGEFTIHNFECVLTAMRDRTPGLYSVELDHTWTNGSDTKYYTLWITESGEVEMGVRLYSSLDAESSETWEPTQRCTPLSADFFDACLPVVLAEEEANMADKAAWDCVFPWPEHELPWFESCESAAPTCE